MAHSRPADIGPDRDAPQKTRAPAADAFVATPSNIQRRNEVELLALRDMLDAGTARIETSAQPDWERFNAVLTTVHAIRRIKSRSKKAALERGRIVGLARRLALAGWARPAEAGDGTDERLCDCLLLARSERLARAFFETPGTLSPWRGGASWRLGEWSSSPIGRLAGAGWLPGALIAAEHLTPDLVEAASGRPDSFFLDLLPPHRWMAVGGSDGARELASAWMGKGWRIDASSGRAGQTALHGACSGRNEEAVALLLELGANPSSRDAAGRGPLHELANKSILPTTTRSVLGIGEALIQAGADPLALDDHGQSAHDLALASGSPLLELLAPLFSAQAEALSIASGIERSDAELGARLRRLMERGHRLLAPDGSTLDKPSDLMGLDLPARSPRRPGL